MHSIYSRIRQMAVFHGCPIIFNPYNTFYTAIIRRRKRRGHFHASYGRIAGWIRTIADSHGIIMYIQYATLIGWRLSVSRIVKNSTSIRWIKYPISLYGYLFSRLFCKDRHVIQPSTLSFRRLLFS